tara:strand:- start:758 stop:2350 length:1593 start_codon:yes stop_codon:yes gene_type:complete
MSQNDLVIANQGFAAFRTDLNSALQALGSTNSGTSAPSTTYANQLWYDTTNNILKIRNEDNDAFISLFTLDQSNDNIESLTVNGVITGETLEATGDTSAGDNSAIGYTSAEGLILTGQGSTSDVTIKNDADQTVLSIPTGTQTVQIDGTTTSDFLVVKTTEAGSGSAPDIVFARDSSSPADNDFLGKIVFRGKNDASEDVEYAQIVSQLIDASDGSEDGKLYLQTKVNGSDTNVAVIDSSGLTLTGNLVHSGDLTLDVTGTINLNADSGSVNLADASTTYAELVNSSNDFIVKSSQNGADIIFKGVQSSSLIEAMRIDMSAGGKLQMGAQNEGFLSVTHNNQSDVLMLLRDTSGSGGTAIRFRVGTSEVGTIANSSSGTAYNTSSDYRLKESINYDFDATSRLKQLKPCRFNFKIDKDKTVDGFLAHEVSSIVPEAITGEKDGTQDIGIIKDKDGNTIEEDILEIVHIEGKKTITDSEGVEKDGRFPKDSTWTKTQTEEVYQGIDQSKLVPLLVKTIQELEARITVLESK